MPGAATEREHPARHSNAQLSPPPRKVISVAFRAIEERWRFCHRHGRVHRHVTSRGACSARRAGDRRRQSQRLLPMSLKEARLDNLTGAAVSPSSSRLGRARGAAALFTAIPGSTASSISRPRPGCAIRSNIRALMSAANLVAHARSAGSVPASARLKHLVFASSSSVYGGNTKLPFAVEDRVDPPQSLYAATKKADELMAHAYAHLYRLPTTGLRFFTVYGPWGRPDMAPWLFTRRSSRASRSSSSTTARCGATSPISTTSSTGVDRLPRPPPGEAARRRHGVFNIGNTAPWNR